MKHHPKKYYGIFRFGQYVHHAILYIFSLPSLRKTSDGETFFLVFLNLDMVLRIIQLQESSPTFEKVSELE